MKIENIKPNKADTKIAFETGKLKGIEIALKYLFPKFIKDYSRCITFGCNEQKCNYKKCNIVKHILVKNGFKYLYKYKFKGKSER